MHACKDIHNSAPWCNWSIGWRNSVCGFANGTDLVVVKLGAIAGVGYSHRLIKQVIAPTSSLRRNVVGWQNLSPSSQCCRKHRSDSGPCGITWPSSTEDVMTFDCVRNGHLVSQIEINWTPIPQSTTIWVLYLFVCLFVSFPSHRSIRDSWLPL